MEENPAVRSRFVKLSGKVQLGLLNKQEEILSLSIFKNEKFCENGIPYEMFIAALQKVSPRLLLSELARRCRQLSRQRIAA